MAGGALTGLPRQASASRFQIPGLLEQARVAVVPGSGFGAPGHVRLSFACSLATLQRALDRIEVFLTS